MTEKEHQIYNYLTTNLDVRSTFQEKHDFLTKKTFGKNKYTIDQIYTMFPDIKAQISNYMWDTIETEFGNPENNNFTLSKTISDDKIIAIAENMELNTDFLKDNLKKRNFSTDIETAIDEINTLITEKNERWEAGSKVLKDRRQAANIMWQEKEGFGTKFTLGAPLVLAANIFGTPVEYIHRLGEDIKYGNKNKPWTMKLLDAFSRPGETTKVNWNILNYNPETKKWGYPEHYEEATASLTEAYDELDDIKYDPKYTDASYLKDYVDNYISTQKSHAQTIEPTGFDEILMYIDGENKLDELKTILEER